MKNLKDYIENINEGLICSYDPSKVIKFVKDKFNLNDKDIFFINYDIDEYVNNIKHYKNDKVQYNLLGVLDNDKYDKEKLDNYFNTLGWYFGTNDKYDNKYTNFYYPKFQYKINNTVHKENEYLYHYTLKLYKDKILKFGLVPRPNKLRSNFLYRNRIHLIKDNLTNDEINEFNNSLIKKLFTDNDEIIKIKINISELNINFYVDPNSQRIGYMTYDNILPKYIESIEDYERLL